MYVHPWVRSLPHEIHDWEYSSLKVRTREHVRIQPEGGYVYYVRTREHVRIRPEGGYVYYVRTWEHVRIRPEGGYVYTNDLKTSTWQSGQVTDWTMHRGKALLWRK